MIRALILDDEKIAGDYLELLIKNHLTEISSVVVTDSLENAKSILESTEINLLFLDVEIGQTTGFSFLQSLRTRDFEVIFTTAHSEYAINAIKFSAIDFLLKPIMPEDLIQAFIRFINEPKETSRRHQKYRHLFENLDHENQKNYKLSVTKGTSIYFIAPSEIYWCKGDNYYTRIYLKDNTEFVVSKTLGEFEEMFQPFNFIRVHKSSLANMTHIVKIEQNDIVLENQTRIEISRRRRTTVIEALKRKK